jgi:hypothetical protein
MHKAARPSGGMDSSNPHHWRDGQLCHHGDGVCKVICAFYAVSQLVTHQSGSSNSVNFCPTLACTTPIVERIHAVFTSMPCTAELNMAKLVNASDIDVFLSDTAWAICSTHHTVLKSLTRCSNIWMRHAI